MQRRHLIQWGAAALAASSLGAQAQSFPVKPIKLVIAFPAGGPTDITMRVLADNASKILGQPVVVENKPGAGGTLPAQALQGTSADGYTLAQIPLGVFRLPYTTKINWDPVKDISYVLNVTGYAFGVVVPADSPLKTWTHFVAWAKANPGKLSYGSTGTMTSPHLTMELVGAEAGHGTAARALQGQRRFDAGHSGRAAHGRGRLHRVCPAGRSGQAARAQHLGRRAPGQVPRCTHAQGAGAGPGAELALRHWRTQGHATRRGQAPARCLQAGHGAGKLPNRAGPLRHGAHLHEQRQLTRSLQPDTFAREKALVEKLGLAKPT